VRQPDRRCSLDSSAERRRWYSAGRVIVLLYLMLAGGLTRAASELLPDTESIVARYVALSAVINCCEESS